MRENLSLSRLTFLYTIGSLSTKIITFVTFFFFTFHLSKEDLGYYDLVLSSLGLLAPVFSLQIYDSVLRWLMEDDKHDNTGVIISNAVIVVSSMLLISIPVVIIGNALIPFQKPGLLISLLGLGIVFTLVQYILRGLGHNRTFILTGIIFSLAFSVISIAGVYFVEDKVEWILLSNNIAYSIAIGFSLLKIRIGKYIRLSNMDIPLLKEMIHYAIPLIPNSISWWAILTANRYIIVYFLGVSATGLFSVGMKFPSILLLVTNIFYMAWQERAIKSFNTPDRDKYYTETFDSYFSILFSLIAIAIAATKLFIGFLVESSFLSVMVYVPVLYISVGYQSLSSFFGTGYLSTKKTRGAFFTAVIGAVVTLAASFFLIPVFELTGASFSILLGYLAMFFARVIQTRSYFEIKINYFKFVAINAFVVIVSLLTLSENLLLLLSNLFIALLCALFINRKLVLETTGKIFQYIKN